MNKLCSRSRLRRSLLSLFALFNSVPEIRSSRERRDGVCGLRRAACPWLAAIALAAGAAGVHGDVIWSEGFEDGAPGWTVVGGIWEIGEPDFANGPEAFAGQNVAGTVLDGIYPTGADARLVSPVFTVPAAEEFPKLRYWFWYDTGWNSHFGRLQIRTSFGEWEDLSDRPSDLAGDGAWMQHIEDLRPYAGQEVQIGFRFVSTSGSTRAGWYIDEVSLETGPMDFTGVQDFEDGLGDWSVENGVWQRGVPTAANGPSVAYSGTQVVGTILSGNHPNGADARLVSPEFVVPAAEENPRFRYFYWYDTAWTSHYGQLQIRVDGGEWEDIPGERVFLQGGHWAQRILDLRPYAGQAVQVGFRFVSTTGSTLAGWYIDRVSLETGPLEFNEVPGFAEGYGDWSVEGGSWQIGPPTAESGPGSLSGTNVAGTNLSGGYPNQVNSRLVSPEFTVPAAAEFPRFRFWQWYHTAFNTHFGEVEIRADGGPWQPVPAQRVSSLNRGWSQSLLDLRPYAGQAVQIAFRFVSTTGSTTAGWYIDDAGLETGPMVLPNPDGYEDGFGDWSGTGGAWQVGVPTAVGGPEPRSGEAVAGTVLAGSSPNNNESILTTPEFIVPVAAANPRLVFWHWYHTAFTSHNGRVRLSTDGGANWTDISPVYSQDGREWTREEIDLTEWAGERVVIGFRFVATTGTTAAGWFIDDFAIESDTLDPVSDEVIPELSLLSRTLTSLGEDMRFHLLENAPEGAALDPLTGEFTWTPTEAQGPGVFADIVAGVMQEGSWLTPVDARSFTITVEEINHPPVLTLPADQVLDELTTLAVSASATDPDIPENPLTFSLVSPPAGMEIDPATGDITWTPTEAQGPGSYEITVMVTDFNADAVNEQSMSDSGSFMVTVREINHPPVLTVPADQVINELAPWSVVATAVDSDIPANPLTFSLVDPPAGMTIDPESGVILWTPSEAQGPGVYDITVQVTDFNADAVNENQLSDTEAFQVTVREVNHPPVLTVPADQLIVPLEPWTISVTATDPDIPANPLAFSLVSAPGGMSVDPVSGQISWTPGEEHAGAVHPVTVRVTDSSPDAVNETSLSDTRSFNVEVREVNVAPVIAEIADQSVHFIKVLSLQVEASDENAGDTLTYSLDEAPEGMTINPATGLITWAPGLANVGPHTVAVRVSDDGIPPLDAVAAFLVEVTGSIPTLALERLAGGFIRVSIHGDSGVQYELYASDDLADLGTGSPVLSFQISTSPFSFIDPESAEASKRFYLLEVRPD